MKQIDDSALWDAFVKKHDGHPLQLWGWGETKSLHGWSVRRYISDDERWGSQVLYKGLPKPMHSFAYVPRGPVGEVSDSSLNDLTEVVKRDQKSDVLLIEPDHIAFSVDTSWRKAANSVLLSETLILDLSLPENVLLEQMAKKTRQYIRKSLKSIHVKRITDVDDLEACMKVYRETAKRAGFALHNEEYYFDIFRLIEKNVHIYGAYEGNTLLSFVWLVATPEIAFELYGGISERGQELKANYGLKWEAIRSIQALGIAHYDMNGLLNDGVSNFKRGFASHEDTLVGSLEKPLSLWYPLWAYGLPLAKRVVRLFRS